MKKKEMLKEQKRLKEAQKVKLIDFNDKNDIKKIIYISVGVIVFIALAFLLMNLFNGSWNNNYKRDNNGAVLDNNLLMCGTMFDKNNEEYLVLAFNLTNEDDAIYSALIESYKGEIPLYYLDLESGFNKNCIGDKNNFVNDSTKIKFASQSLLHIKDGKIVKSYTEKDTIKDYLTKEK